MPLRRPPVRLAANTDTTLIVDDYGITKIPGSRGVLQHDHTVTPDIDIAQGAIVQKAAGHVQQAIDSQRATVKLNRTVFTVDYRPFRFNHKVTERNANPAIIADPADPADSHVAKLSVRNVQILEVTMDHVALPAAKHRAGAISEMRLTIEDQRATSEGIDTASAMQVATVKQMQRAVVLETLVYAIRIDKRVADHDVAFVEDLTPVVDPTTVVENRGAIIERQPALVMQDTLEDNNGRRVGKIDPTLVDQAAAKVHL